MSGFETQRILAAKDHVCGWCGLIIERGMVCDQFRSFDLRSHTHCTDALDIELCEIDDEIDDARR